MTTYFTELGFCFQPLVTPYTLEDNACLSLADATEGSLLAAWTDGTWWRDFPENGGQLVGWIELDGQTFFPPLESYPIAQILMAA